MRRLVSFMHASLDGFVAGPNGEMNWILVDDEIFDYVGNIVNESDLGVYGRKTYEMMEGYWPTAASQPGASKHDIDHARWYNGVAKLVISNTLQGKQIPNTRILSSDFKTEIDKLKGLPGKKMVMFGSPGATHSLMRHNLIDEYWVFVNPIVLGKGIPLFADVPEVQKLTLMESRNFGCGVVALRYGLVG